MRKREKIKGSIKKRTKMKMIKRRKKRKMRMLEKVEIRRKVGTR